MNDSKFELLSLLLTFNLESKEHKSKGIYKKTTPLLYLSKFYRFINFVIRSNLWKYTLKSYCSMIEVFTLFVKSFECNYWSMWHWTRWDAKAEIILWPVYYIQNIHHLFRANSTELKLCKGPTDNSHPQKKVKPHYILTLNIGF